MLAEEVVQPGLVERALALVQPSQALRVGLHTDHLSTHGGQARGDDCPNVPAAYYRDAWCHLLLNSSLMGDLDYVKKR